MNQNTAMLLASYSAHPRNVAPANDNNTHPCWRKIEALMAAVDYEIAHRNDTVRDQLISAWGRVIYV